MTTQPTWSTSQEREPRRVAIARRERATAYYAAERNCPQLLDTLAEVVQKPVTVGDRVLG